MKELGFVPLVNENGSEVDPLQSAPWEMAIGMDISSGFKDSDKAADVNHNPISHVRPKPPKRIMRMRDRGLNAQLLTMAIGGGRGPGRQNYVYPVYGKLRFNVSLI